MNALRRLRSLLSPPPTELPEDFDWRSYLDRYRDLRDAGVASATDAARHYREHGSREGRWATAPSYPTRTTLACSSIHSLYLRATGSLVCWDDAGNDVVLQAFDPTVDYAHDVYLGTVFNSIRQTLSNGRLPFESCKSCLVLQSNVEHSSYYLDKRVVEIFQIEPSYKCSLDCPGCVPLDLRRSSQPQDLPLSVVRRILGDFVAAGVEVRAFDFQGHGDPLMNPRLWEMTAAVREVYPSSFVTITTNALGVVRPEVATSGIDEVICSIDGVDDATYSPYRVHGRFDVSYRFMRELAALTTTGERPIKVVWKYILFEHNSSPEALARLQLLAEEAAVDELVLVVTRNGPRARQLETPADVPLRTSSVPVSFRFHAPDVGELVSRLAMAQRAIDSNDIGQARELSESLHGIIERFYRDAPLPDPLQAGIEMLARHGF